MSAMGSRPASIRTGRLEFGEETGAWSVDKRALYVGTASLQGEGVICVTAVYLTCAVECALGANGVRAGR